MQPSLSTDNASVQRGAAVFSLAAACATIVTLSGVFMLRRAELKPAIHMRLIPDGGFRADWMDGTVSAAGQQASAANQWLHLILVFAALAAAIALINGVLGLLAHSNERRYETALRGLVGASPRAITMLHARNALLNTILGAAAGVPAGLLCAFGLQRAWHRGGTDAAPLSWIAVALIACVAVSAWSARAARARTRRPGWMGDALAPEARSVPGLGTEDLRAFLTIAQLSCAIALSIIGGLVWSYSQTPAAMSAYHARGVQVGHAALGSADAAHRRSAIAGLLSRLNGSTGVSAESIASPGALLGIGRIDNVVSHCGRCVRANMLLPMFPVRTQQHVVGGHFFSVAGIRVLQGREFEGNASDAGDVVINRSFAVQAFDTPDPLGKVITINGFFGKSYRVIGVVADVPARGLHTLEPVVGAITPQTTVSSAPAIYFSAYEHPPANFDVIIRGPAARQLAGLEFMPLSRLFDNAGEPQSWFSGVLMMIAIQLYAAAMIGAAITTMLSIKSREVEIAVRRAVGARKRDIWQLVFLLSGNVAWKSVACGILLSLALSRVLEVFVPGLPAFRVDVTVTVVLAFVVIAALATVLPARAAAELRSAAVPH